MLFGQDRNQIRGIYCEAWRKARERTPLEPLEHLIVEVIEWHPEYHALLEDIEAAYGWEPQSEAAQSNPFLHMGMHIALREQLQSGRPSGIGEHYRALAKQLGDAHEAEHQMMECLGEVLWQAQSTGTAPSEQAYLECLGRRAHR